MRRKAIYILIGSVLIFGITGFFFLDLIVKWSLERSLETIVGAQVDARRVHLDLTKLRVKIQDLQITNPRNTWRNIIQAKNIQFQIASEPLFEGKTVIDEIVVDELVLNTARQKDGKLNRKPLPGPFGAAQAKLNKDIAEMPVFDIDTLAGQFDVNKLLADYKFDTDLSALDIRNKIEQANVDWHNNLKELDNVKVQLQEVKAKLAAFKASKTQNILELNQKLNTLKDLQKSLAKLQNQVGKSREGFSTQFNGLNNDIDRLKQIADGDYRSLLKKGKLPDYQNINIAESLLGKNILNESTLVLNLIDQLQRMMPAKLINPAKELHPRNGQNITFLGRKTYPRFLIKHISVSGRGTPSSKLDGYYAKANVDGVTSEPAIYGSPMLINVYGQAANHAYLKFNGRINHLTPNFSDQMNLELAGLPLPELRLTQSTAFLPAKLTSGIAAANGSLLIEPEHFLLNVKVDARNITGDYSGKPEPTNFTASVIREVFSKIDLLTLVYQLEGFGQGKKLKITIDSNLNELIGSRIRQVIGDRIALKLQAIRAKVDSKLKEKQTELQALRLKYQTDLAAKLNQTQSLLDEQKAELDAKKQELEGKLPNTKNFQLPTNLIPETK